jgi:hypothetical protein
MTDVRDNNRSFISANVIVSSKNPDLGEAVLSRCLVVFFIRRFPPNKNAAFRVGKPDGKLRRFPQTPR